MAIAFGVKQLSKPTPSNWANGIAIFTVVASTVLAWIGTASFISASTSSAWQSILGLAIGIANSIKPFLGVQTSQTSVPIEEVKQMDEPKK